MLPKWHIKLVHLFSGALYDKWEFKKHGVYCVQLFKWNNDVYQTKVFQSMITWKCLPGTFYIKWKEGERELTSEETESVHKEDDSV